MLTAPRAGLRILYAYVRPADGMLELAPGVITRALGPFDANLRVWTGDGHDAALDARRRWGSDSHPQPDTWIPDPADPGWVQPELAWAPGGARQPG